MSETRPAGDLKADVRGLFATPVVVAMVPDAAEINRALETVIFQRETEQSSTDHSNLGGWQSTWDFTEWGGPALDHLLNAAKALASRMTTDRQGRPASVSWQINCWANVNRRGHGNEFHTHPGAFWSGTYYVRDGSEEGDTSPDADLGGEFEAQDPRGVAPAMYAPNLTFAGPGGPSVGASELIRPRAGMMILFPSWLSHAVRPYRGEGVRVSIAFNLSL